MRASLGNTGLGTFPATAYRMRACYTERWQPAKRLSFNAHLSPLDLRIAENPTGERKPSAD